MKNNNSYHNKKLNNASSKGDVVGEGNARRTSSFNSAERRPRNSMQDQLKKFQKNKNRQPSKCPLAHITAVTDWKGDGVDHINVNAGAVTPIGRFLAHDSGFQFVHPKFGRFASSRSFWLWLKSRERDDRLRSRTGNSAYLIYRTLTYRQVPNSRAIMLEADYHKLKQYPDAMKAFMETDLPIDCYFYDRENEANFPRRPSTFYWMVEGLEEIRDALKNNREPNFSKWIDVPGSEVCAFVFNDNGSTPDILTRKERVRAPNQFRPIHHNHKQKQSVSAVVDIQNQNKTADLDTNQSLKNEVHTVDLTVDTQAAVAEVLPSETTVVDLVPASQEQTPSPEEIKVDIYTSSVTSEVPDTSVKDAIDKALTEEDASASAMAAAFRAVVSK